MPIKLNLRYPLMLDRIDLRPGDIVRTTGNGYADYCVTGIVNVAGYVECQTLDGTVVQKGSRSIKFVEPVSVVGRAVNKWTVQVLMPPPKERRSKPIDPGD